MLLWVSEASPRSFLFILILIFQFSLVRVFIVYLNLCFGCCSSRLKYFYIFL